MQEREAKNQQTEQTNKQRNEKQTKLLFLQPASFAPLFVRPSVRPSFLFLFVSLLIYLLFDVNRSKGKAAAAAAAAAETTTLDYVYLSKILI